MQVNVSVFLSVSLKLPETLRLLVLARARVDERQLRVNYQARARHR